MFTSLPFTPHLAYLGTVEFMGYDSLISGRELYNHRVFQLTNDRRGEYC